MVISVIMALVLQGVLRLALVLSIHSDPVAKRFGELGAGALIYSTQSLGAISLFFCLLVFIGNDALVERIPVTRMVFGLRLLLLMSDDVWRRHVRQSCLAWIQMDLHLSMINTLHDKHLEAARASKFNGEAPTRATTMTTWHSSPSPPLPPASTYTRHSHPALRIARTARTVVANIVTIEIRKASR